MPSFHRKVLFDRDLCFPISRRLCLLSRAEGPVRTTHRWLLRVRVEGKGTGAAQLPPARKGQPSDQVTETTGCDGDTRGLWACLKVTEEKEERQKLRGPRRVPNPPTWLEELGRRMKMRRHMGTGLRASRVTAATGTAERSVLAESSRANPAGSGELPSQAGVESCSPPSAAEGTCSTAHNPSATLFFKQPLGSEPQHLLVRASANTALEPSPWARPSPLPAQRSEQSLPFYPSCLIQSLKRAVSPPSVARPKFFPPKPVLQSTFTPGALFKGCSGCKQTLFTILQESQCPSLCPEFGCFPVPSPFLLISDDSTKPGFRCCSHRHFQNPTLSSSVPETRPCRSCRPCRPSYTATRKAQGIKGKQAAREKCNANFRHSEHEEKQGSCIFSGTS